MHRPAHRYPDPDVGKSTFRTPDQTHPSHFGLHPYSAASAGYFLLIPGTWPNVPTQPPHPYLLSFLSPMQSTTSSSLPIYFSPPPASNSHLYLYTVITQSAAGCRLADRSKVQKAQNPPMP